jgi:hypothetical protein
MKKRVFVVVIAFIMVFAFVDNSFAAVASETYSGSEIYRAKYCGTYTKSSGVNTKYIQTSSVSYVGGTKTYHYARAYSVDGNLYGSRAQVYYGAPTPLSFNTSGTAATSYKIKIENAYYYESGDQTHPMSFSGNVL